MASNSQKKNKVKLLLAVNNNIKIGDKTIPVDPLLLFQRIYVMKKSDEKLEFYLKYELAPSPLSLFDYVGMRKITKVSLFQPLEITFNKENSRFIIDGRVLLYRVKWPINCNYEKVFQEYISYLKRNVVNHVTVVFDAYDGESTKVVEKELSIAEIYLQRIPVYKRNSCNC